jgi:hypothetical protein
VRPRRRSDSNCALTDLDQRVLGVLCAHRVVRQDQLGRLFGEIPERTLRYRTRRLHELGLAGRSRPYRDRGSAPNHHWPTRRADALMRGDPLPRGGERHTPNPVFLGHAAALTELYVTLSTGACTAGLSVQEYHRETREPFTDTSKERVLAPDAMVVLVDRDGRQLGAFVEIDLGTMSHTRLRAKAELYAAYAASDAWHERHLFLPALLFLTTTDTRAGKFLKALARSLSYGRRHAFVAGAAGIAWAPHRLLAEPCLADLDGNTGLALLDILNTARAPYERARARELEQREAEEERRRVLRDDPEAMREHVRSHESSLQSYLQALGPLGEQTMRLLLAATSPPDMDERAVLGSIARDLDDALLEPRMNVLPPPGPSVTGDVKLLADFYRSRQGKLVTALTDRHWDGPSLRQARRTLQDGGLIERGALDRLAADAERDAAGRQAQARRQAAYLEWREQAARQLARKAGPLGRLTHRPEDFYEQVDRQQLRICRCCGEIVYPAVRASGGLEDKPDCHYCHSTERVTPWRKDDRTDPEGDIYR